MFLWQTIWPNKFYKAKVFFYIPLDTYYNIFNVIIPCETFVERWKCKILKESEKNIFIWKMI